MKQNKLFNSISKNAKQFNRFQENRFLSLRIDLYNINVLKFNNPNLISQLTFLIEEVMYETERVIQFNRSNIL